MAADSYIKRATVLSSFHADAFFKFEYNVLSVHRDLHDHVNWQNAMDGAEPVLFDEFLYFRWENKAKPIFQVVNVLQSISKLRTYSITAPAKRSRCGRQ